MKLFLRRHVYAMLAVVNLCFWIALACLLGLLGGDRVDLGLETLLRTGQATVVAAWEQQIMPSGRVAQLGATASVPAAAAATPGANALAPASPSSSPGGLGASPASSSATAVGANPPAQSADTSPVESLASVSAAVLPPTPALSAASQAPAAIPSRPVVGGGTSAGLPNVASGAAPALRTAPLLLADAAFSDLSQLNAEMDRSAPGRAVQIRYQETALNREILALLAQYPDLPYSDVAIDVQHDRILVTGKVSVLGFEVDAAVEGTILARDCQPHFEIESVSVASIVAPSFVKARVAEMVQEAMAWYPAGYPLCIEQVVLEEARASIYGERR